MSALVAVSLACLQGLPWPLAAGVKPFPLRATYGQIEGSGAVDLHFGLDVLTVDSIAEGDSVRAMEAGTVVALNTKSEFRSGLIIESDEGRLLLYLHLDPSTIQFALGDTVATGKYLGTVTWNDPYSLGRHVHISVLGSLPSVWTGMDKKSSGNPLRLQQDIGDTTRPGFKAFSEERPLVVRRNESGSTPIYSRGRVVRAGEVDVIVNLYDLENDLSSRPLAPAKMELTVESAGVVLETFALDFDRSLEPWHNVEQAFYNRDGTYKSQSATKVDLCKNYFVLTNGSGGSIATANSWHATPGTYTLRVRAWDAANNVLEFQDSLEVVP